MSSSVEPEGASPPTRYVFLRRLPNKLDSEEISRQARRHGNVIKVLAFHQRGSAVVEFEDLDGAKAMVADTGGQHPIRPLVIGGRIADVCYGKDRPPLVKDPMVDDRIEKECARCIKDLVKQLVKQEAEENRQARILRRQKHRQLLRDLERRQKEAGLSVANDICWDYTIRGGSCPRGEECRYRHEFVSVNCLPPRLRAFLMEDSFPESREGAEIKQQVNSELVSLSSELFNPRALVLDGPGCMTVNAIKECPRQQRRAEDMVVPNNCTSSYMRIAAKEICRAHHGSLRSFLEQAATTTLARPGLDQLVSQDDGFEQNKNISSEKFGLVYLDYCARLYAGKFSVEKSPVADLRLLFSSSVLDPGGCVLAITLSTEEPSSPVDAPQHLRHLVARLSVEAGLVAIPHAKKFHYAGNFVEIFLVASPECISVFFRHPDVAAIGDMATWNTAE